jgi:hypothetical protein
MNVVSDIDQGLSTQGAVVANRSEHKSVRWAVQGRVLQVVAWLVGVLGCLTMPSVASSADVPIVGAFPATIYEIDLTYVGEQTTPTVALQGPPRDAAPLPYRPFQPILELQSVLGESTSFGPCQGQVHKEEQGIDLQWSAEGQGRCGQRIAIHQAGAPVDLMSYHWLRLRGFATGSVVVALDDQAGHRREDNVPLATVTGSFDITIALKEAGRRLDLRYVTAIVVSTEAESAHIHFDRMEVIRAPSGSKQPLGIGFWVWNYRSAMENPEGILATCRIQACSRLLIQMPSQSDDEAIWRGYVRLMAQVQHSGLEALALDGYPEAIQEPHVLADKIRRVLQLAEPGVLSGVQLDLEPYLLPGFLEDEVQLRRYVDTIEILKRVIDGRTRLSIVLPFWLAGPTIGGRPLAYAVMDRADEVAVMSYRTNLDDVQDIADDILRYGAVMEIPVWLAVETTMLPVERHVVLRRETDPARIEAVLDRDRRLLQWVPKPAQQSVATEQEGFRIHHRYTVNSERLSFAGRSRTDVSLVVQGMLDTTSSRSFAGVLIHDLDGFRALPK